MFSLNLLDIKKYIYKAILSVLTKHFSYCRFFFRKDQNSEINIEIQQMCLLNRFLGHVLYQYGICENVPLRTRFLFQEVRKDSRRRKRTCDSLPEQKKSSYLFPQWGKNPDVVLFRKMTMAVKVQRVHSTNHVKNYYRQVFACPLQQQNRCLRNISLDNLTFPNKKYF